MNEWKISLKINLNFCVIKSRNKILMTENTVNYIKPYVEETVELSSD
jgi:hypothetical protein